MRWRTAIDWTLETAVVPSFTRVGPALRRRIFDWEPLAAHRMDGRTAVVTGATSGLGLVTARELARLGASVVLLVRDTARGEAVSSDIAAATGNNAVRVVRVDMGDLDAVRKAAVDLGPRPIDVLVHNAGAMSETRTLTERGIEQTVATHLVGPFLLTHLLGRALRARPSRVIFVTSGGMYTEPLAVDRLEMEEAGYSGVTAYARAKRAQVGLVEYWAPRLLPLGITLNAMHPGWADTPGLRSSLPMFTQILRPLLRSALDGADTIVWLASAPSAGLPEGALWLDRRPRPAHRIPSTRHSDTEGERQRLWEFLCERSGISPAELRALA
ncbi:MAG TPA: SDR family NAD(P)-dependent oxidoreductase [Candidatus Dormibacteraeota bacterium]|nr:SDR family NAD(P)-dependent oxidoreductase [Candidatus Dormibacteraeota bacterium]